MKRPTRVLFVCLHGAAKSVIAAQYLGQLALEKGLSLEAGSAGVEPDPEVPPHVLAGLAADGINHVAPPPRPASDEVIAAADIVVSFGCDITIPREVLSRAQLIRWDDVPAVSDGYAPARDAIVAKVCALLAQIPIKGDTDATT